MSEKSVKNYIEWSSQSTKRLDFSWSKMTYMWVISVEDDLFLCVSSLGRYPIGLSTKFQVECIQNQQNQVWGPPGPEI